MAENIPRSHLQLVSSVAPAHSGTLDATVRAARRAMARLLRAVQASGRSVSSWPDEVVTRLAHVDAMTARYLIDPTRADAQAATRGAAALGALQRWVIRQLSSAELAEVRAFELMIQIDDESLAAPLLRPDGAPEEQSPSISVRGGVAPRSLRSGLRSLDEDALAHICRRLGVRPLDLEAHRDEESLERATMERAVARTLRDDHLLSILVSTLSSATHELLAALVRGQVTASETHRLLTPLAVAKVAGGEPLTLTGPLQSLRACGLAYGVNEIWVPVELQRRLDGVLRAFGV